MSDTGMEPADSSNSKVGIFVNFTLTIEKLHHAPEATQLVVCLTFHVLVYNAFNRDIQYFWIRERQIQFAFQTSEGCKWDHPVLHNADDDIPTA